MRVVYNEELKLNDIYLDKDDKCYLCSHQDICPLINALETHFVYIAMNEANVHKCEMFKLDLEV